MAKHTKKKYFTIYQLNESGVPCAFMKDEETRQAAEAYVKEFEDFARYTIITTYK
ncbi:MAG: hypothetical protein AAFQ94_09140 [Bacteroidota bacterium]